jgi:hypothetical protein
MDTELATFSKFLAWIGFSRRLASRDKLRSIAPVTSLKVSMQTPESGLEALSNRGPTARATA